MLKNRFKHFIGRYPFVFFPFYKLLAPKPNLRLLYSNDTDLVIEGYPRSANTFSVVAFELAQSKTVKIAHHLHVEAQLIKAATENKPAVALLRNPEDSFRSLLVRHPETSISWAVNRYIQFYTAVKKLGENCLIVNYEDAIHDMGAVVELINKRFGSNFDVPVHDEAMVKNVFSEIESINQRIYQGKESHIGRPSNERKKIAQNIDFTGYEKEIRCATELYESIKKGL